MDREQMKKKLDDLIVEGNHIHHALVIEFSPDSFKKDNESHQKFVEIIKEKVKYPKRAYQIWYDSAYEWVRLLRPRKLEEFEELYTGSKHAQNMGDLHPSHAGIKRFFQGQPIIIGNKVIDYFHNFNTSFNQQQDILIAIRDNFDNPLFNLETDIRHGVYESEMNIAKEFQEHENLRMAGAIASLVIEVHLKNIAIKHGIPIKEKTEVSDYNNFLKRKGVCDSGLSDQIKSCKKTRNKCIHTDKGDPSDGEISTIIHIADRVINEIN